MNNRSEAQKLIAKLEAQGNTEDTLIASLISTLKDYDQEREHVEHLEALHLQHRQVVAVRTHIIMEAAMLRREGETAAHWTMPIEAAMPPVFPL
jgi:hypothetical protein